MKEFFTSVSAVSVILSAAWLLVPKGSMEKSMKYALGIFVTAALVISFGNIDIEFPDIESNYAEAYGPVAIETETIETVIQNILEQNNIKTEKVTAVTDISSGESINITKVVLELENKEDFNAASEIIMSETGLEAEVH